MNAHRALQHLGRIIVNLVRTLLGMKFPGKQMVVYLHAGPRVNGRIALLAWSQLGGLPVGEPLVLGYALSENQGKYLLEAVVGNLILLDECLQLDETGRGEFTKLCQRMEVIFQRKPDFLYRGVLENRHQPVEAPYLLQAEKEALAWHRKLHQ